MILHNRFDVADSRDVTLEKVHREGVAYLRVVPSERGRRCESRRPLPDDRTDRTQQVGPLLLWFVEFSAFMAFPVIIIIMALHPQLFCLTSCVTNGNPSP